MVKEEYKYSEITERVIGCSMRVHSTLGNGFQEVIYQIGLLINFGNTRLEFKRLIKTRKAPSV